MNFIIETNEPTQNEILHIKVNGNKNFCKKLQLLTCSITGILESRNGEIVFVESIPIVLVINSKIKYIENLSYINADDITRTYEDSLITENKADLDDINVIFNIQIYLDVTLLPTYSTENYKIKYYVILRAFETLKESSVFQKLFIVKNQNPVYSDFGSMFIIDHKFIRLGLGNECFETLVLKDFYNLMNINKQKLKNLLKLDISDLSNNNEVEAMMDKKELNNHGTELETSIKNHNYKDIENRYIAKENQIDKYLYILEEMLSKANFKKKIGYYMDFCCKYHLNDISKLIKPINESFKNPRKFSVTMGNTKIADMAIDDVFIFNIKNLIKIKFHENTKKLKIKIKRIEKETNFKVEFIETIYRAEYLVDFCYETNVYIFLNTLNFFSLNCFYFLCTFSLVVTFDGQDIEIPIRINQNLENN